ncbi:MAG: DNA alkylation repair protein [Rhodothermales bacterium]|nr:DNA alkylation repair protein [Rhodothermales bacterium]
MAHPAVSAIIVSFEDEGCEADAAAVQRYMKSEQPFYGIKSPLRRRLIRAALKDHPIESREDFEEVVRALWAGEYRDEQYAALDIAESSRAYRGPQWWDLYEELLPEATWWDTLDWIAARLLGPILLQEPSRRADAAAWIAHPSVWMRRASLLVHLKHRDQTNVDDLAEAIETVQHEKSFWIRKAIGWVLRSYAETDPDWVIRFVKEHPELSGLSKREALRKIEKA